MTYTDLLRNCELCGDPFTFTIAAQKRGKAGRFCSRTCGGKGITAEDRKKGLEIVRAKSPELIERRAKRKLDRKIRAAREFLEANGYRVMKYEREMP